VAQVREKDVLKCITTVDGELCVMIDSLTHRRGLLATCSDTGRFFMRLRIHHPALRTGVTKQPCATQ